MARPSLARRDRLEREANIKRSIADAVVIKDGDLFFVSQASGDVPVGGAHGLGLYHHDCRYLDGYALLLDGEAPTALDVDGSRAFAASFVLTNPAMGDEREPTVPAQRLVIDRRRVIDAGGLAVHEIICVRSFSEEKIVLDLDITLGAELEDVFVVRGASACPASAKPSRFDFDGRSLRFSRDCADGLTRCLDVRFSPPPARVREQTATWDLELAPRGSFRLVVDMRVIEAASDGGARAEDRFPDLSHLHDELHRSADAWLGEHARVASGSGRLDFAVERALLDLRALRSTSSGHAFFAGGTPWYAALFGRDSLISAYSALAFEPNIAAETLRLLAEKQGTKHDEERDEEPGKILHELRVGELARAGEIPFDPYYGTVDATLLFLVLLAEHAAFSGSLALFHELSENVERALGWARNKLGEGGYVAYSAHAARGLDNHGWKDSGDAIVNADGSLAEPPIALCEVQGYAYRAFGGIASLFERDGRGAEAASLRALAADLLARFNRDFWMEQSGFLALARQAGGRPAAVVSSNAGQALWSGIVDPDKADRVAARLMADDMWSGWGVRTLSTSERRYSPVGYHLGTVWPHDNALIAAGLRRYGHDEPARRIAEGILDLATHFPNHRLPELITGFGRAEYHRPVRYPVACHPQAWAAGAVLSLLQTMLGLAPDAFAGELRVTRPILPARASPLLLTGLRVGAATLDLRFEERGGAVRVDVLDNRGGVKVVVTG